jgi:hypothetical protein
MGAKDPANAKSAQSGAAQDNSAQGMPAKSEKPVKPCGKKHWFSIRLEAENGKVLDADIKVRLKLNNGEVRDVVLSKASQPDGRYSTDKFLDLADACEVSFPDVYDAECRPK